MTYPQSGPGYGQGDAGQSAYGQQQYGQQAGYGGYQAPKPPSQGLPANTPTILAAVIGGLGVITLFLGFLAGFTTDFGDGKLFETVFVAPYTILAVAGVLALVTFLLGTEKWVTGVIFSLTVVSALVTIFQFSTSDASTGAGAIILLITSILSMIAAIVWLLIDGGQIKTAPAVGAAASPAAQPAAAPVADASAYGSYGQQAAQPAQPATYGQSAQPTYGQPAAPAYGEPTSSPSNPVPGDAGATTAFQKPDNQQ